MSLEAIPYQNLAKFPDWQFVTFAGGAPDLPNLTRANVNRDVDRLRPVAFMVVCDRLVKGITESNAIAECLDVKAK